MDKQETDKATGRPLYSADMDGDYWMGNVRMGTSAVLAAMERGRPDVHAALLAERDQLYDALTYLAKAVSALGLEPTKAQRDRIGAAWAHAENIMRELDKIRATAETANESR